MNPTVAIIIADDLKFNRFAIRRQLETLPFPIYEAANGQHVIDLLTVIPEEKVILCLDMEMPLMDGLALLNLLYEKSLGKFLSIIITSSNDYHTYHDQLQQYHILGFIDKPVDKSTLLSYIEKAIES